MTSAGGVSPADGPDLIEASDDSICAYFAALARWTRGGRVAEFDEVLTCITGLPLAMFNTAVVRRQPPSAGPLAAAVEELRRAGVPFQVRVRDGLGEVVTHAVSGLGLRLAGSVPAMVLTEPARMNPVPAGVLQINRAVDEAGLTAHADVCAASFGVATDVGRQLMTGGLGDPDAEIYVGHVDGRPVSASMLLRTGVTAGVYNVATLPQWRRRGYGAAMTAHAVADGVASGCSLAVLQASDMGYPIYEAMGFRTIARYLTFEP